MAYRYGSASVDDDMTELNKINAEVLANPDEFENWERLIRAAESLEGGLNRNSSPQSIQAARDAYDRFLARYPLFFGYWKKYADLEFAVAGTESAEYIYEHAVACVSVSTDLWVHYCQFKIDTCHDVDLKRELFERAADSVGLDFLAHPFWDKFIDFEKSNNDEQRVFAILSKIIHYPLHQYARYFEHYRSLANNRPLQELAPEQIIKQFIADSTHLAQVKGDDSAFIERDVRAKIDVYYLEVFRRTQEETTNRWTYEAEIKRPYFHVTNLDEKQLTNWTKYLDFEEGQGDYARISFLYERCLVTCAHYDEYWQRYVRWMYSQPNSTEEVRAIFTRASCFFAPIARPAIRKQWAMFEEAQGRPDVAVAIYEAILSVIPDHEDAIVRLANLQSRQHGIDAAIAVYDQYIASDQTNHHLAGALVGHASLLIYQSFSANESVKANGSVGSGSTPDISSTEAIPEKEKTQQQQQRENIDRARAYLEQHRTSLVDSEPFWRAWLVFETRLPATTQAERAKLFSRVRNVHSLIRNTATSSRLSPDSVTDLSRIYMAFLTDRGGKEAAGEWIELDALVEGSAAVVLAMRQQLQRHQGAAAVVEEEEEDAKPAAMLNAMKGGMEVGGMELGGSGGIVQEGTLSLVGASVNGH